MLGKLIKHEFRATRRVMLPLAVAVLLMAALSGYSAITLDREVDYGALTWVFVLSVVVFAVLLMSICVVSVIIMIERFYKNLLGGEGYLMFTLPVSVDALIWAKLIVSFVWFCVTAIASMLAMVLMGVVSAAFAFDAETIARLWRGTADLFKLVGAGNIIAYIFEGLVLMFLFSVSMCLHFYLAMSIGQSFSNHKALYSVLAFFAISIVMSMLSTLMGQLTLSGDGFGQLSVVLDNISDSMSVDRAVFTGIHLVMLGLALTEAVTAAIYYIPTTLLLKKRLNLA